MTYGSRVGLFPSLHPAICRLAQTAGLPTPFHSVLAFINSNREERKSGKSQSDRDDFLTKLISLQEKGKLDEWDVITSLGANIAAGSDTTGITLSTIVYYLARNESIAEKFHTEIDLFEHKRQSSKPVTFQECQKLPYLQAVLKEALRIHPATGQLLSRIVPSGGAVLAGQYFPEGVSRNILNVVQVSD